MKWLCVGAVMATLSAFAAEPAKPAEKPKAAEAAGGKLDGAKLYMEKTCWSCHGKDAKTPLLPDYPRLAGQSAAYAEKQIHDIKSGKRNNGNSAAMQGVLVLVNDAEIRAIAEYLSTLK